MKVQIAAHFFNTSDMIFRHTGMRGGKSSRPAFVDSRGPFRNLHAFNSVQ
jgi:hypothetical protein